MEKQSTIEGYWNVTPVIKKISFERGTIHVELQDGRIIIAPLKQFPSIKKLKPEQRKKWYIFGNGFSFDASDEIFHIEQILGNFDNFKHES